MTYLAPTCPMCGSANLATVELWPAYWPIGGWNEEGGPDWRDIATVQFADDGSETDEVEGEGYHLICLDCREEWYQYPDESVDEAS